MLFTLTDKKLKTIDEILEAFSVPETLHLLKIALAKSMALEIIDRSREMSLKEVCRINEEIQTDLGIEVGKIIMHHSI